MTLVLEIECLTGVFRASRGVGDDSPDWPPQPDRVFSALVSAWGIRGESRSERSALEWLESQPPPVIHASGCTARTAPDVFVPPNDASASTAWHTYLRVLPGHRRRQPRRFPVARPDDPSVRMVWPDAPDTATVHALNSLAGCVGYVGHSASLTRCRFIVGDDGKADLKPAPARRRVYPGRLQELIEAHDLRPDRPVIRPGAPVFPEPANSVTHSEEWLVLEAVDSETPDIRASALVGRLLRKALMAGYRRVGLGGEIPEVVSGHTPDGSPTRRPHVSIVPMAFVGSRYSDGRVFGFALIPPPGESLLRVEGLRKAFETVAPYRKEEQRRVLTLQGPPLRKPLLLAPERLGGDRRRSLDTDPYLAESTRWASVTPIVLDRHLKRGGENEVRALVVRACQNAGLPPPDPDRIQVGKHSAVSGAAPARPSTSEPRWLRWRLPQSLESRQLVHAVIDFDRGVRGPVLLGAGRFTGLGLFRSVEGRP